MYVAVHVRHPDATNYLALDIDHVTARLLVMRRAQITSVFSLDTEFSGVEYRCSGIEYWEHPEQDERLPELGAPAIVSSVAKVCLDRKGLEELSFRDPVMRVTRNGIVLEVTYAAKPVVSSVIPWSFLEDVVDNMEIARGEAG